MKKKRVPGRGVCCAVVFARSLQNKSCPLNITHTHIHTGKTNMAQVSPQKQRGQEAGSLFYTQGHPVHPVLLHKLPHPPLGPDLLSVFVRRMPAFARTVVRYTGF